jgi:site-specific recombinase XerD
MKLKNYYQSFLEYKKKEGCVNHTIGEYKRFLFGSLSHCSLQDKKIQELKMIDVAEVIEAGKTHGEYGSQRSVVVFRQLLKFLEDSGEKLPFNWTRIKVPAVQEKDQDFLTENEFENFINKIPINTFYGLRDRALYETLWSTGLRIGELLVLKKDDLDWQEREAKIKTLKGGDPGKVYFSPRCIEWLKRYLGQRADTCPALFVVYNQGVKPLTKVQARKNLLNYRKKFGIKKEINHPCFRRSFATFVMEKEGNLKAVQYLCRHKSERTTLRAYVKFEKRKVKEVHQRVFN